MDKLLAKLPAFALPFVTRSLRGGRGKRYLLSSMLLVAATLLVGFWIALGTGQFERDLRRELELEGDLWARQYQEFVVYSLDRDALANDRTAVERLEREGVYATKSSYDSPVFTLRDDGRTYLRDAAHSLNAVAPEHVELREHARRLIGAGPQYDASRDYFPWHDVDRVARLQRILDRGGIPEVRRYESPLSLRESLAIVGSIAGLVLALAMTLFGPLLVGMQQAQEQHENTLTPLTGTGLRPRELALGLASGPLSVVAIFAAPQLVIFLGCAAVSGDLVMGLGLLAALTASSVFVTFAAQLLGHLVGPKRTPGIVTLALMVPLTVAWVLGASLALEMDSATTGFAAVLPTMGLSMLLARTFAGLTDPDMTGVLWSTLAWSGAALMFAWLTLSVLARKIEARPGSPLGAGVALLGALTCIGLIHVAIPEDMSGEPLRLYFGLAVLFVPFALLLMGRVPTSDNPPRMRALPVPRLLLELGVWCAIHIAISATLFEMDAQGVHPIAMLWIAWCVGVLGLMAIRLVALPSTMRSHFFLACCGLTALMGFIQAIYWAFESRHSAMHLFALFDLSPIAGVLQVGVTVATPLMLMRTLRTTFASLTTISEPSIPEETR